MLQGIPASLCAGELRRTARVRWGAYSISMILVTSADGWLGDRGGKEGRKDQGGGANSATVAHAAEQEPRPALQVRMAAGAATTVPKVKPAPA